MTMTTKTRPVTTPLDECLASIDASIKGQLICMPCYSSDAAKTIGSCGYCCKKTEKV
jgi:hypothetical protein